MALNDECKHNISDEDCYKCMKLGIIFGCPVRCEYFEENLRYLGEAMKEKQM